MTTLVLAHKKIKSFLPAFSFAEAGVQFADINKKGIVTICFLGFIGLAIISYLTSLYITFDLGFKIRDNAAIFAKLNEDVLANQLELQQEERSLTTNTNSMLKDMEEVSVIKYVSEENPTTVSLR